MGHSRPLFLYFRLFNTVDSKQMFDKSLPMPGFEPWISGIEGDRSTTEPQPLPINEISYLKLSISISQSSLKYLSAVANLINILRSLLVNCLNLLL